MRVGEKGKVLRMSENNWDIDVDLCAWSDWSKYQNGAKTGYPSAQPFTRMGGSERSVSDFDITDEYAMVVDRAVANLSPLNSDLYVVIGLYYLHRYNVKAASSKLGWSVPKFRQKLTTARDVVKGMVFCLQQEAANDEV